MTIRTVILTVLLFKNLLESLFHKKVLFWWFLVMSNAVDVDKVPSVVKHFHHWCLGFATFRDSQNFYNNKMGIDVCVTFLLVLYFWWICNALLKPSAYFSLLVVFLSHKIALTHGCAVFRINHMYNSCKVYVSYFLETSAF